MSPDTSKNTTLLARRRVEQLRLTHARLIGVKSAAETRESELARRVAQAKARLALGDDVNAALEGLQQRAHQRAVGAFERLLSAILGDVLPGKGAVKLALGTERGAPALDVQIDNAGAREDALDGSGGAVTNVLSAGLRFAALSRTANRKLMVLDEPDCWLKPERVPAFIRVLAEVAQKANTQTVLISHHEPGLFEGLVNIVRLNTDAAGQVRAQVLQPQDAQWPDAETPGVRSIRLINFRAHADTTLPLFPGVTALIGDNDLGKSTLAVTALRALAYGESDDTVIRHGETEARVQVQLERGRMLEWVRRAKGSPRVSFALYENGERIHEGKPSARGQVPEWISSALGVVRVDDLDIQLGSQKSPVFLLNESPARRAQLLSVGRESGRLHTLIEAYGDLKRRDREQVREGETEIGVLRHRIKAAQPLATHLEPLERLAALSIELEQASSRQEQLGRLLGRAALIEQRYAASVRRAQVLESVPSVPALLPTQELSQLLGVMARAQRTASLQREFPSARPPVIEPTQRLGELLLTMQRARGTASLRREFPAARPPVIESTQRLGELLLTMQRTSRVAALSADFEVPAAPELWQTQPLVALGQRIARLSQRRALLPKLPAAPAVPVPEQTEGLSNLLSRFSARVQACEGLRSTVLQAEQAAQAAAQDLTALIEEMGGVCPSCGGELHDHHQILTPMHGAA